MTATLPDTDTDRGLPRTSSASITRRTDEHPDRWPLIATVITCLIAALSYAGVVSMGALGVYVMVGVGVGAVAANRGRGTGAWWRGALVGSIAGLIWAEAVNIYGGDISGPIARSTFVVSVGTAFAVALIDSPAPSMFLVPVGGIILGAMTLGGAGEVGLIAIATVVSAVVTLALIERKRRRWLIPAPAKLATLALSLILVVTMAAVVSVMQVYRTGTHTQAGSSTVDPSIRPPWQPTPTPTPTPTPSPSSTTTPTPPPLPPPEDSLLVKALPYLLLLILIVAVVLLTLWIWHRWKLARLRRHLRSGTPAQRTIGAWLWAKNRLAARGIPFAANVSPDLMVNAELPLSMTPESADHLRTLAVYVRDAAFTDPALAESVADAAWSEADQLVAGVKRSRAHHGVRAAHR